MTTWLNTSFEMRFRVIDGLTIRYAQSDDHSDHALLLSPWPESLLAFLPMWESLAESAHLVAIDLPGFGRSQHCDAMLSPQALGEFIIRAADAFGLEHPHVIGPDIGTAVALFAAAQYPGRLRSLVVGGGAAAIPLQLGGLLKDWVETPDPEIFRGSDPRQLMTSALAGIKQYVLPDSVRDDYLSSYEGNRFAESVRYLRSYPASLPSWPACYRRSRRRCRSSPARTTRRCHRSTPSSSVSGCPTAGSTSSTRATSPGKTPPPSTRP